MKKQLLILVLALIALISINYYTKNKEVNFDLASKEALKLREQYANYLKNSPFKKTLKLSKAERKALGIPPNKYYEREWELTMNPATGKPEPNKIYEIQKRLKDKTIAQRMPGDAADNAWVDRGPNNVGGRTRVVLFDPNDTENKKVYAGGVSGGLWVNDDITNSASPWTQVSGVPGNMNISCITVDPNNSNIWYIGTGEQYTFGAAVGNGVYKTTDGGANWVNVPVQIAGVGDLTSPSTIYFSGIYYINDIIAWDNGSSTEVFIGVGGHAYGDASNKDNRLGLQSAGLYRTIDGGTTWARIESVNMQFSWSGFDFYFIPNDFEVSADNTLWMGTITTPYIGGSGGGRVFSSSDGATWTQITTLTNSNRVELAVSSSDANKLYALTQGDGTDPHIFATTDGFSNMTELTTPVDVDTGISNTDFTRGQAFYDLVIEVDPTSDAIVYVGGIDLFRSQDSGLNWSQISKWSNNNNLAALTCSIVHADQHAFTFRPGNSNEAVIGCDGGVYYASDLLNADVSSVFTVMNTDYNVTQFYYGGYGQESTNELIIAGSQDNGSQFINGAVAGANSSFDTWGGDGAYSTIDKDGTYMITSYTYSNHYYYALPYTGATYPDWLNNPDYAIDETDDQGDFINPAGLDHNLNIMYSNGTGKINRYTLGASSATKAQLSNALLDGNPTAFKVSPFTTGSTTLLVGTDNGKLLKLINANNVNTSLIFWDEITGSSFVGSISSIEFGETENDIFVTFHNYGVTSIWYTSNGGASWVNKEGRNLPDIPVKCILQNPLARNEVIIGTELGVWETKNFNEASPLWSSSYNGMSDVKVVDLDLRVSDNTILATTHGRGLFTGQFTNITNATYTLVAQNSVKEVCKSSNSVVFNFEYNPLGGYATTTSISVSGLPSGATSILSASTFNSSNGTFDLTINDLNTVATGEYIITITGIGGPTISKDLLLIVKDNVAGISTLLPIDGAIQMDVNSTNLTWNTDSQATEYDVEIATDAGFNTVIESATTYNSNYTIGATLNLATVYYWHVRTKNSCNTSAFSEVKKFQTALLNDCASYENNTSVPINNIALSTSTINVPNDVIISKVNVSVNITHSWIQDLDITLISPNGTSILLFSNNCTDEKGLDVTFDDDASSSIICGATIVSGTYTPTSALSGFIGEDSLGNWDLKVYDGYNGDTGTINSWSLEICNAQTATNSTFTNSPITVGTNSTYILKQAETEATSTGSTASEQLFMMSQLPTKGDVKLNNTALLLGETFTQDDINTGKVTFVNSSGVSTTDAFKVDITNATSGFLPNQKIDITIDAALVIDNYFFEKTGVSVYPTVSDGNFIISSSKILGETSIEIYSIIGQKVFVDQLNFNSGNIERINANHLASGVYILKLTTETLQGSKKIIIK